MTIWKPSWRILRWRALTRSANSSGAMEVLIAYFTAP
jgi:hypothetical protein